MKATKLRKRIINELYRSYHGLSTISDCDSTDVDWLRRRFGISKKQAQGIVDFVRYEEYKLPSYTYYVEHVTNDSEIWEYYYDNYQ